MGNLGNDNQSNLHVFGLWEETGKPEGNAPNMGETCKLRAHRTARRELNPGPRGAMLHSSITKPMCRQIELFIYLYIFVCLSV